MKKLILGAVAVVSLFGGMIFGDHAHAYVSVKGYYKSNGTYVEPHVRSEPNGLRYDNYGYKPSQGLYNDSYGTNGGDWDTPTYVTDPDYYEGKSIYEKGTPSSVTPTIAPVVKKTSVVIKKPVVCRAGYGLSLNKAYCIKIPANAHYVTSKTDVWLCDEDYHEIGNRCIKKQTEKVINNLSNNNYYINSKGNKVHSPAYSNSVPVGATAKCKDGIYSFSQSRRGTCSGHGGVATWL